MRLEELVMHVADRTLGLAHVVGQVAWTAAPALAGGVVVGEVGGGSRGGRWGLVLLEGSVSSWCVCGVLVEMRDGRWRRWIENA